MWVTCEERQQWSTAQPRRVLTVRSALGDAIRRPLALAALGERRITIKARPVAGGFLIMILSACLTGGCVCH